MKVKLFWQPNCPRCPQAKELLADYKSVELYNISEVDGLAEATYYDVMATPSIIVFDDNDNEVHAWRGDVPNQEEFSKWI